MEVSKDNNNLHDTSRLIVLYDGVCGLCNRSIQFILKRDKTDLFRFAALQSEFARTILDRHHRDPDVLDTIIVVLDYEKPTERILLKARAALYCAKIIGGVWKLFYGFSIFPNFLLNFFYNLVAKYRYKIFGKYDSCPLPDEKVKSKFIEI